MTHEEFEKNFNRTLNRAEQQLKEKRDREDRKIVREEIYNSITHAQISLEKMMKNLTPDQLSENKEHIDNIYYHLGAIKGCL